MKILFIQPKIDFKKGFLNNSLHLIEADEFYYLHLSIYHIAQITSLKHKIKVVDERFKKIKDFNEFDLIVITCSTPFSSRAYNLADLFRKNGKKVILGGPHPSLLPNEAKQHSDSVLIGEPDGIWNQVLIDCENDTLKDFYKSNIFIKPEEIKKNRFNLKKNILMSRVEASRGCPNRCNFCLVSIFLGTEHRLRPIENVIEDIKRTKRKIINFDDSSLTINPAYTKKLFKEMKELNKKFTCCGNTDVLKKDDELLFLAKQAGCCAWFIGFESFNQKTLDQEGKKTNIVDNYKTIVEKIHKNKMAVIGSFMFGFDTDKKDVFKQTLNLIKDLGIDAVEFNILGLYPGTPLFEEYEKEGRILTKEWSEYHFGNVVFQPKNMNKKDLEFGTWNTALEYYSFIELLKRSLKTIKFGLYPFIIVITKNLSLRRFYKSWKDLYKNK